MNYDSTVEQPAEITVMAAEEMMRYGLHSKAALLSHSNFGNCNEPCAVKMRQTLALLQVQAPWMDGMRDVLIEPRFCIKTGLATQTRSKRVPLFASASICGVLTMGLP